MNEHELRLVFDSFNLIDVDKGYVWVTLVVREMSFWWTFISSYTDGLITTQDLDAFSTNVTSNIGGTLWKRDEIIEFVNSIDLGQCYFFNSWA